MGNNILKGKKGIIFGALDNSSIAWKTAESVYNEGGEFILTAANNAHYSSTMPAQHHAQDVIRAIENDRWTVRATNTGYSGVVDPHGRTIWLSEINTYVTHTARIYRRKTQTLYVKLGDWLTPLLVLGGVFTKIIIWLK